MSATATITRTSFELQDWSEASNSSDPTSARKEGTTIEIWELEAHTSQQLDAVDGGFPAWRVLIGGFVFEALLWGFPISFGVFQEYYSTLPQFAGSKDNIALIGTIAQGSCYLGAPFSAALTKRFPRYQRQIIWFAWPLCIGGLVAASYADTIGGLIATQGIMYGVGFITLTYPIISMINEYWIARKGMAFGLISAASGASGAVMPFIIQDLLARYGYKTTLRIIAVAMAILTGPLLPVFKGRLPPSERSQAAKTNWSFVRKPLFYIYAVSTLLYGLGVFFPLLYLPSYATSLGLSATQGALLLSTMSIFQVLGQFFFGYLSDRNISVGILCSICMTISTTVVFSTWGLAKSLPLLLIFSIIYGFFASAFSTLRVAMGKAVSEDSTSVVATYSIFVFIQGIGNILAGPLSVGLLAETVMKSEYGIERYKSMVIFTGACMFGSAAVIAMGWCRLSTLQKLLGRS
ncbi:hypothetical protein BLS_008142 [Venturia inaequalis]|uniref:Major facilitator superfamily (MFS) profile domain-containing protein n=1 Tax=Venturia inaequalis TaxID=5025 RepID=A0A8H3YPQ7_VENIN|nr:hypothetical protein BLS_008142 [Venturia inaequalis]KAE9965757.1 hypothetical protein EG328_009418 [Venturia inaequalis]